jgi:hypothetical protein
MDSALPKTSQFPGQPQAAESKEIDLADHWRDFATGEMLDNEPDESRAARGRNRFLLIPSARIFDSSAERGTPNRAAAPDGPNT